MRSNLQTGRETLCFRCSVSVSREQLLDHLAVHVRKAEVAALEAEGELGVVEAEEVDDGGLEVVDVDSVLDSGVAEFVAVAEAEAGLHAAAGEPHGVRLDMVVAADA